MSEAVKLAHKAMDDAEERRRKAALAEASGSGEAEPLMTELRSLAETKYPLCHEARLLLQMAVEAQQGKPIDVTRLIPNAEISEPRRGSASPTQKTL